jgi:hypothetical protein
MLNLDLSIKFSSPLKWSYYNTRYELWLGIKCKVNARVHSPSSTLSTKAFQSVCLEHGVISAFTSISSSIHMWRTLNTLFCQSGNIQISSLINFLTGQLGYIRCWSNGTWIRKPHPSMLLSSFDSASFIIPILTLILPRSRTGTVWFYTSTSNKRAAQPNNKRAAQPKLYTKSLTRDLKRMYSRLTLVRISINL